MNALRNWLQRNPGADDRDQMVARSLLGDLSDAVGEARGAGRTQ